MIENMEILYYYDTKKNKKRDFTRYQVSRDGARYVFEELLCHNFGKDIACHEIERHEFETEKEARATYENCLREK